MLGLHASMTVIPHIAGGGGTYQKSS